MAHTSGNAPRATRHKKKTQRNDARANTRTGKQQDNVAGKTGKQRRADRRKTDILRDTAAQSLRRLTNEALAEVNRVHKNDPEFAKKLAASGGVGDQANAGQPVAKKPASAAQCRAAKAKQDMETLAAEKAQMVARGLSAR